MTNTNYNLSSGLGIPSSSSSSSCSTLNSILNVLFKNSLTFSISNIIFLELFVLFWSVPSIFLISIINLVNYMTYLKLNLVIKSLKVVNN